MTVEDWHWRIRETDYAVLCQLCADSVSFLLVGGTAACYHGAREIEAVDDLDILLRPSLSDAEKFVSAIQAVAIHINTIFDTQLSPDKLSRPNVHWPLKRYTNIDFLTAENVEHFDQLHQSSSETAFREIKIQLVSKFDLVRMKQAAASIEQSDKKHLSDLNRLLGRQ